MVMQLAVHQAVSMSKCFLVQFGASWCFEKVIFSNHLEVCAKHNQTSKFHPVICQSWRVVPRRLLRLFTTDGTDTHHLVEKVSHLIKCQLQLYISLCMYLFVNEVASIFSTSNTRKGRRVASGLLPALYTAQCRGVGIKFVVMLPTSITTSTWVIATKVMPI